MVLRILAATATLAVAVTGATAFVSPSGKLLPPESAAVTPIVEPGKIAKKSIVIQKQSPIIMKKTVIKPPVMKKPPPVVKGPIIIKKTLPPKIVTPPILKKVPPNKIAPNTKFPPKFVIVKPYKKHKHHGRNVAGVILGTILAASAYYAYTAPPADDLCWYWTSSAKVRGYWDYCELPDDDD